jgi:lipoprotein-anchoring transpeptidase ErfK/SrfK
VNLDGEEGVALRLMTVFKAFRKAYQALDNSFVRSLRLNPVAGRFLAEKPARAFPFNAGPGCDACIGQEGLGVASVKTIFPTVVVLLLMLGAVVGGVFGWQAWQTLQARQALAQAKALLDAGKPMDADRLLGARLAQASPSSPWAASVIALRLTALRQANDAVAEQALARKALDAHAPWVHPGDEGWARAQLAVGEAALRDGQADAARQAFQAILSQADASAWGRDEAQFGLAKVKLANADEYPSGCQDLQALMERLTDDAASKPLRLRVESILGTVNYRSLMDHQPHGNDQSYVIQKGDSVDRIHRKFKIAAELFMHINGIANPKLLSIGRRVKIPDISFSIIVNKKDNILYLLNHGKFFKSYRIATGQSENQTPTGDYTIGAKSIDGTGGPAGSGRWMGFLENPGVGIHGVNDPKVIGTRGSIQGVGMTQDDVSELYDLLARGTSVKITGERPTMTFGASDAQAAPEPPASSEDAGEPAAASTPAATRPQSVLPSPTPGATTSKKASSKTRRHS